MAGGADRSVRLVVQAGALVGVLLTVWVSKQTRPFTS